MVYPCQLLHSIACEEQNKKVMQVREEDRETEPDTGMNGSLCNLSPPPVTLIGSLYVRQSFILGSWTDMENSDTSLVLKI